MAEPTTAPEPTKAPAKSYSTDPALYIYTSLTAGSSHIVTATSRLETILRANKIPFKATDLATDEKAKMLWGRRAGKDPSGRPRKMPALVQKGMVLGDLVEVEEWNEYGELKQHVKIYYDAHTIPPKPPTNVTHTKPFDKAGKSKASAGTASKSSATTKAASPAATAAATATSAVNTAAVTMQSVAEQAAQKAKQVKKAATKKNLTPASTKPASSTTPTPPKTSPQNAAAASSSDFDFDTALRNITQIFSQEPFFQDPEKGSWQPASSLHSSGMRTSPKIVLPVNQVPSTVISPTPDLPIRTALPKPIHPPSRTASSKAFAPLGIVTQNLEAPASVELQLEALQSPKATAWSQPASFELQLEALQSPKATAWSRLSSFPIFPGPGPEAQPVRKHRGSSLSAASAEEIKKAEDEMRIKEEEEGDDEEDEK